MHWPKTVKPYKSSTAARFLALSLFIALPQLSFAAGRCQDLFISKTQAPAVSEKLGVDFLITQNRSLHQSPAVEKSTQRFYQQTGVRLQKPADKVSQWIDHLDSMYLEIKDKPKLPQNIKDIFYKQYVIKEQEVPQSYFDFQVRLAREQGHGNIALSAENKKTTGTNTYSRPKAVTRSLDRISYV
ncbi:MAG: hypothetical protein ACOYOK_02400 [Pseudobdellovibrionaceae bacterium]